MNINELTSIEKYKIICHIFKKFDLEYFGSKIHQHHIKPKSIYPELENDKQNIVRLPSLVHWAVHELLKEYSRSEGADDRFKNMKFVNLEDFLRKNENLNLRFDKELADTIIKRIFSYYEIYFNDLSFLKSSNPVEKQVIVGCTEDGYKIINVKVFHIYNDGGYDIIIKSSDYDYVKYEDLDPKNVYGRIISKSKFPSVFEKIKDLTYYHKNTIIEFFFCSYNTESLISSYAHEYLRRNFKDGLDRFLKRIIIEYRKEDILDIDPDEMDGYFEPQRTTIYEMSNEINNL